SEPKQRILGLSVRRFWIILIVLVVVVAGAIGGGVGGGLAARNASSSAPTRVTNTDTPTATTPSVVGGVSPAPTDGGCPGINNTVYTPLDASGKTIQIQSGGAIQWFRRYCDTNWPAGPGVRDIMKLYMPSLEDCITACAMYNAQLCERHRGGGIASGIYRAVSMVKATGEYCYLKNNTGKMDTLGKPELYSSAVLCMSDEYLIW
ncbi:hypothetical protein C8A00DRAFT_15472, partial [Chaetomidium leptoderma]